MHIGTSHRRAGRGFVDAGWALAGALIFASSIALSGELADPTRPASYRVSADSANSAPGRMRVEAILNRGGQRLAIIDGKVVRAGDRIADARIDEVLADGVRYTRAGASQLARLASSKLSIRRAPASQEPGS
jgi:MSHA biogenesis protein MshK